MINKGIILNLLDKGYVVILDEISGMTSKKKGER